MIGFKWVRFAGCAQEIRDAAALCPGVIEIRVSQTLVTVTPVNPIARQSENLTNSELGVKQKLGDSP